ncbi:hypothetical protein D3C80_2001590 [compost metagenome]
MPASSEMRRRPRVAPNSARPANWVIRALSGSSISSWRAGLALIRKVPRLMTPSAMRAKARQCR